jgi:hypothetical protein
MILKTLSLTLAAIFCGTLASAAPVPEIDPTRMDLGKLVECTTYDVPAYNSFALWLTGPDSVDAMKRLGLSEIPSGDPLLRDFKLAAPITVFGRQSSRVVFASTGPLAVLDEADPHPIAGQLGVTAAIDTPTKYLGAKDIVSQKEQRENSDTVLETRISLNVSTVDTLPGKVLAGCSYSIEVE